MLESLILENEKLIERFEVNYYLNNEDYAIAAALKALEITNEVQKCYFNMSENENISLNILKLYALLQSLFVSVDSLYALALSLTKSKSFININKNPELRELKYIRNDVVGHPANRVYNSSSLAYCILDEGSVKHKSFSYNIYSSAGVTNRVIEIFNLVEAYYQECNNLLNELYNIANDSINQSKLVKTVNKIINLYSLDLDYFSILMQLKQQYLNLFETASSKQHRLLWRIEIIEELQAFSTEDLEINDLVNHAVGLELLKILELVTNDKNKSLIGKRNPYLVSSFYRFLNNNKNLVDLATNIDDIRSPLFLSSINHLILEAKTKNNKAVVKYLIFLKELYDSGKDGLLYALALPIREYKKKSKK